MLNAVASCARVMHAESDGTTYPYHWRDDFRTKQGKA